MDKAIFIDKDGTLINDIPYNVNPDLITLAPRSIEGLKALNNMGFKFIAISNQSGIAKGYFQEEALRGVEEKIQQVLRPHNLRINGFYYCPHSEDDGCECRKPKPELIFRAASDFGIDISQSWMIGDILNDVEAGNRAGCNTILIDNGNETEWLINQDRRPSFLAKNINQAADIIQRAISLPQSDALFAHE
jgi:D-glycero-D-manno-heptose 1,7-bisphosphate phosphatase